MQIGVQRPSPEVCAARIAAGEEAQRAMEILEPSLRKREMRAVNEMLAWYRGGDVQTPKDPYRGLQYIAALNEVYATREEFSNAIRLGQKEQDALYAKAETTDSTDAA